MIEADLRHRLVELEYKNRVQEENIKHLSDSLETELYFLKTRLTICERISSQIEQAESNDVINRNAALKPYEGLKDDDTICVGLIRKNIEQQPAAPKLWR